MELNDFKKFQNNLRTTSVGLKFADRLFKEPYKLDSRQIVTTMRSLGLQIPEGLEVYADAAQMIASGQAIMDAYETATDYQELIKPSVSSIGAISAILSKNGMLTSEQSMAVNVGSSIALLIATGGADIRSWVSLALSVGSESMRAKVEAEMRAKEFAIKSVTNIVKKEQLNMSRAFDLLQKGEVGIFGFLTESLTEGALLFDQSIVKNPAFGKINEYLPGLQFLPKGNVEFRGEASETTWWGQTFSDSYSVNIEALATGKWKLTRKEAFDFLFKFSVEPFLKPYLEMDMVLRSVGHASFFQVIPLIGLNENLRFDYSCVETMKYNFISPSDLGYDLGKYLPNYVKSFGISSSEGFTSKSSYDKQKAIIADKSGFTPYLFKTQETKDFIDQNFGFQSKDFGQASSVMIQSGFSPWDASNFLASLDMLDCIVNDPIISELGGVEVIGQYASNFPRVQEMKERISHIINLSMIRKNNYLAKSNVASFLGLNTDKMKVYYPPENSMQKFSVFRE